jgi:hypothetical protein
MQELWGLPQSVERGRHNPLSYLAEEEGPLNSVEGPVHDLPGPFELVAFPHCRPGHVCSAGMRSLSGMISASITRFPRTCHPLCLADDGHAEHALTSKAVSALGLI